MLKSVTIRRRKKDDDDDDDDDGGGGGGNYRNTLQTIDEQVYIEYLNFRKMSLVWEKQRFITESIRPILCYICPLCNMFVCSNDDHHRGGSRQKSDDDNKIVFCGDGISYCPKCESRFVTEIDFNRINRMMDNEMEGETTTTTTTTTCWECELCKKKYSLKVKKFLIKCKTFKSYTREDLIRFQNINSIRYSIIVSGLVLPPPFLATKLPSQINAQIGLLQRKPRTKKIEISPSPAEYISSGRINCFRKTVLSKRSFFTSRAVMVPAPDIASNEIILNREMYSNMGEPEFVLTVRYPVIDFKCITFHEVVSVWDYPVIGFPPTLLGGNCGDFDGDSINCYSLLSIKSVAEGMILINPKYSFLAMGEPRLNFTHDQILLMHLENNNVTSSLLKKQLTDLYYFRGSRYAFDFFEKKRKSVWSKEQRRHCKPSSVSNSLFIELLEVFGEIDQLDLNFFSEKWNELFNTCILNAYVESQCTRLQIEHIYQLVIYLRGMNMSDFLNDSKSSRKSLSKATLQHTGYSTHKLSFVLPEVTYQSGTIVYNENTTVHNNLRTFSNQVIDHKIAREIAIYRAIKR